MQKSSFDDADSYINYLLTEGEFFMGKSQSETSPYWPTANEIKTARPRFDIFP